jgi:hypothetical protein
MFIPLIAGFVGFTLIVVLIGWWVDPDRDRPARR